MKWSNIPKAGCLAILAVPAYVVGVAAYDIGKTVLKHPRMTLATAAMTGFLWYNCADVKQQANALAHNTIQTVQQYRAEKAEERRNDAQIERLVNEYNALEKEADSEKQRSKRLEDALQQRVAYERSLESRFQQRIDELSAQQAASQQAMQQAALQAQAAQNPPQPVAQAAHYTHAPETPSAKQHRQAAPEQGALIRIQGPQRISPNVRMVTMTRDPEYHYYFVDVDETLNDIGKSISTNPRAAAIIAQDNSITDPRQLLAGQELRIRKQLYDKGKELLWDGKLDLQSIVLKGDARISETFTDPDFVLKLNRELGIRAEDGFKYQHGARIVHY